jgi:hypothetical protein
MEIEEIDRYQELRANLSTVMKVAYPPGGDPNPRRLTAGRSSDCFEDVFLEQGS